MKIKNGSSHCCCTYQSNGGNTNLRKRCNGGDSLQKSSLLKTSTTADSDVDDDDESTTTKLRTIIDIYVHCMLLTCVCIIIFVSSRPLTEDYLIRLIFGESLNYCNYTYIPSKNNYRRPYKVYD
ncbi:unnamed protein product [Trichobilharzia regenti]|nr:unnamed protein product [Trichobilharzia regenti]